MSLALKDNFGRTINYLRLSVTDRCNLRCTYCMDEKMTFLPRKQILDIEEMLTIARAFVALGIKKIRLTGGEPLIRPGIINLCRQLKQLQNVETVTMTTNGILLHNYAQALKDTGLDRINISIDSLRAKTFKFLTRGGKLEQVLTGIKAVQQAGFQHTKLNVLILDNINNEQIFELTNFALNEGLHITFIEEMPLGKISSHRRSDTQINSQSLIDQLNSRYSLKPNINTDDTAGPANYYCIDGYRSKIGFISPLSQNFCSQCNRVRLTATGRLLSCLGHEHSADLKSILRQSPDDHTNLQKAIIATIQLKPERHFFDPQQTQIVRFMNTTGG